MSTCNSSCGCCGLVTRWSFLCAKICFVWRCVYIPEVDPTAYNVTLHVLHCADWPNFPRKKYCQISSFFKLEYSFPELDLFIDLYVSIYFCMLLFRMSTFDGWISYILRRSPSNSDVNKTLWCETETKTFPHFHETETFIFTSETRRRPRPHNSEIKTFFET